VINVTVIDHKGKPINDVCVMATRKKLGMDTEYTDNGKCRLVVPFISKDYSFVLHTIKIGWKKVTQRHKFTRTEVSVHVRMTPALIVKIDLAGDFGIFAGERISVKAIVKGGTGPYRYIWKINNVNQKVNKVIGGMG